MNIGADYYGLIKDAIYSIFAPAHHSGTAHLNLRRSRGYLTF
jgi:hypothetical protein